MELRIGCSGWFYKHWIGNFYPQGMAVQEWLPFYARSYSSVEVNTTFYHWPKPDTVRRWADGTDGDFRFVIKGTRLVTHDMAMVDTARELGEFISLFNPLTDRGPLYLWQYPPHHKVNRGTIARLRALVAHLSDMGADSVFEFRDPSWLCDEAAGILSSHGYNYVMADAPEFHKRAPLPRLGPSLYLRMHGLNGSWSYTPSQMEDIVGRISVANRSRQFTTIWAMFNNDPYGNAVRDAGRLISGVREVGLEPIVGRGTRLIPAPEQLGLGF